MRDYTEIRDHSIRSVVCDLMSEMLDNPDEHGIYPTSNFMGKMEDYIIAFKQQRDEARKLVEETADEWDAACQVVISEWRAIAADKDAEIDEARKLAEEWVAWGYEEWQGGEGVLDRPTNKLPWKVYKIKEKQVE